MEETENMEIDKNVLEYLKKAERTEEVQDIIERMPTGFGIKITGFVICIVIVFFTFGWIIKYPDAITGSIVINASSAPIKLVSNTSGKLILNNFKNYDDVNEKNYIGFIQNSANFEDVQRIAKITNDIDIKDGQNWDKLDVFPRNVSLGELNIKYFTFINAFSLINQYRNANLFDKQAEVLKKLIEEYKNLLIISTERLKISSENLKLVGKFHLRDSILFTKKVISEAENDRARMTLISAQDSYQNMLKDISVTNSQLQQTENQLKQNEIQKMEKEKQLELDLITSFTELEGSIQAWEQKYAFKAPMDGKVQFLKFWTDNQYIQVGEPVFTIVPSQNNIVGQMTLPSQGAGKAKVGQEVIIKLDNYPYTEYGSIRGIVSSISLTTNPLVTKEGAVETYLVNIDLPDDLRTNYGAVLDFKFEIKGTGEIITNQRRLLERLFDNLKYKLNQ